MLLLLVTHFNFMTKHSLSAPLLIGIAGCMNEAILRLLNELDVQLSATPIYLLMGDTAEEIKAAAFGVAANAATNITKLPRMFAPAEAVKASIDQQRAAYLLKNCSFVINPGDGEQSPLYSAIDAYKRVLPFWAPATNDAQTFGKANDAFSLPYPAPVLDTDWLATLVRMTRESCTDRNESTRREPALWAQARQAIFGKQPITLTDAELLRKASARERSAFVSLPGQLRQLDAFNAELASLAAEKRIELTSPVSMRLLMEATDKCAEKHQNAWQNLVYTTTKRLANIVKSNEKQTTEDEESTTSPEIMEELKKVRYAPLLPGDDIQIQDKPASWKSLAMLGVVAATLFAAFTELATGFENHLWQRYAGLFMMSAYLMVLGWALWRYCSAKVGEHERKHQDYRLIVECLRVQQCWANCGIRHYVADSLPAEEVSESTWVSNAIRAIRWRHSGEAVTWSQEAGINAKAEFISVQLDYHNRNLIQRREKALKLLNGRARIFLRCFLVGLGGLFLNSASEALTAHGVPALLHHGWIILTVCMVSLWAAHKKVADTFGLEGEILRGKAVRNALAEAHATLTLCLLKQPASDSDLENARQTLLGIGKTFVQDQAAWHALHRSRPIEVVTGA